MHGELRGTDGSHERHSSFPGAGSGRESGGRSGEVSPGEIERVRTDQERRAGAQGVQGGEEEDAGSAMQNLRLLLKLFAVKNAVLFIIFPFSRSRGRFYFIVCTINLRKKSLNLLFNYIRVPYSKLTKFGKSYDLLRVFIYLFTRRLRQFSTKIRSFVL